MTSRTRSGLAFWELIVALVCSGLVVGGVVWGVSKIPVNAAANLAQDKSIDELGNLVKSGDPDEKIQAILELGSRRDALPQSLELILPLALDPNELVRVACETAIANLGSAASPHLKPWVESSEPLKYLLATVAIKSLGPDAAEWTPALVEKLSSPDTRTKMASLFALEKVGPAAEAAIDQLLPLLDHQEFNVVLGACRVLAQIGPAAAPRATPKLMELARSEDALPSVSSMATLTLGALGPLEGHDVMGVLLKKLNSFYLIDKERALIGLAYMGPRAEAALPRIEKLMQDSTEAVDQKSEGAMPQAALTYFRITGKIEPALEVFRRTADAYDYEMVTIERIADLGPDGAAAAPIVIAKLSSPEDHVREAAIWALMRLGPQAATPAKGKLQEMASSESDTLIREAAKRALALIEQGK